MSIFPGADAAYAEMGPPYNLPENRMRAGAYLDQHDNGYLDAERQFGEIARRDDVTVPAIGTPYATHRVQEALAKNDEYIRNTAQKPPIHVDDKDQIDTDGAAFASVGLIHAWNPRIVHEISPGNPIWKILHDKVPLRQGERDDRSSPCDMPDSVSVVGGGSIDCTNIATSYVIAPAFEKRLIFVFRACEKCRDEIRTFNRIRTIHDAHENGGST